LEWRKKKTWDTFRIISQTEEGGFSILPGGLVFWWPGVLVAWCSGGLVFWWPGVLVAWCSGGLVFWTSQQGNADG
jgi:hypothetical protein